MFIVLGCIGRCSMEIADRVFPAAARRSQRLHSLLGDGRFANMPILLAFQFRFGFTKSRFIFFDNALFTHASYKLRLKFAQSFNQIMLIGPDAEIMFLDIRRQRDAI